MPGTLPHFFYLSPGKPDPASGLAAAKQAHQGGGSFPWERRHPAGSPGTPQPAGSLTIDVYQPTNLGQALQGRGLPCLFWLPDIDSESRGILTAHYFAAIVSFMGKLARPKHQKEDHGKSESRPVEPFRVIPHNFGFDPKIDLDKMNSLADELATTATIHPEVEKISGLVPPAVQ